MNYCFRVLVQAIVFFVVSVHTYASPNCDAVLRPNEEKFASDYDVVRAYMRLNAENEYDRLNKMDSNSRSADASYKLFSIEYNESSSRKKFQENVRNRLSREAFEMKESEARALSRIFVTDVQVAAWVKCEEAAGGGAVLIVANDPNASAFPIKISFMPQTGIGEAIVQLELDGGKINSRTSVKEKLMGKSSKAFIVKPVSGSKQVVITANVAGLSDTLTVDLKPRVVVPPPSPPLVPTLKLEKLNPLYVGATPNCNAAIVTSHQNHLNCTNLPLGYTIKNGEAAQQLLYLGNQANVNAGVVTTKVNFKGGTTTEWGYTIRDSYKVNASVLLYVVVGCGDNDGEVTSNSNHKNCPTTPIGYAHPW
jgi:hypothetical protein